MTSLPLPEPVAAVPRGLDVRVPRAQAKTSSMLIVAPTMLLLAGAAATAGSGLDTWVADQLYAWQGGTWALRDAFLTSRIAHEAGRDLSTLAWLGVFVAWLSTWWRAGMRHLRAPLMWLLLTTLAASLLVAWTKSLTNMDCPWDLIRYGGDRPFIGLFTARPEGMPRGVCFPAGHASSGYAWLSLVFFLGEMRPRWQAAGLALVVAAGLVFGIAQQLRGAHFLSHDLVTAALCWCVAALAWRFAWPRREEVRS